MGPTQTKMAFRFYDSLSDLELPIDATQRTAAQAAINSSGVQSRMSQLSTEDMLAYIFDTFRSSQLPCLIKSEDSIGEQIKVQFQNKTFHRVDIFWVDPKGSEKFRFGLDSGSSRIVKSYLNHIWVARTNKTHYRTLEPKVTNEEESESWRKLQIWKPCKSLGQKLPFANDGPEYFKVLLPSSIGLLPPVSDPQSTSTTTSSHSSIATFGQTTSSQPGTTSTIGQRTSAQDTNATTADPSSSTRDDSSTTNITNTPTAAFATTFVHHSRPRLPLVAKIENRVSGPRSLQTDVIANVEFHNTCSTAVEVFWLNYIGEEMYSFTLPPNERKTILSHLTHVWVARKLPGPLDPKTAREKLYTLIGRRYCPDYPIPRIPPRLPMSVLGYDYVMITSGHLPPMDTTTTTTNTSSREVRPQYVQIRDWPELVSENDILPSEEMVASTSSTTTVTSPIDSSTVPTSKTGNGAKKKKGKTAKKKAAKNRSTVLEMSSSVTTSAPVCTTGSDGTNVSTSINSTPSIPSSADLKDTHVSVA